MEHMRDAKLENNDNLMLPDYLKQKYFELNNDAPDNHDAYSEVTNFSVKK